MPDEPGGDLWNEVTSRLSASAGEAADIFEGVWTPVTAGIEEGSIAASQITEERQTLDPINGSYFLRQGIDLSQLRLFGVSQLLRGIERAMRGTPLVFVGPVLARQVIEASARACRLLVPDIDMRTRLSRVLNERLHALFEAHAYDGLADRIRMMKDIEHWTTTNNFHWSRSGRHPPWVMAGGLKPEDTKRLGAQEAISLHLGEPFARMHRFMSAKAHLTDAGTVSQLTPPTDESRLSTISLDLDELLEIADSAIGAFLIALRAQLVLTGSDTIDLDAYQQRTFERFSDIRILLSRGQAVG